MNSRGALKLTQGILATLGIAAVLAGVAACTTTQLEQTTGLVAGIVGGDDPERAAQVEQIGGGITSVAASRAPITFETERALGGGVALRAVSQVGPRYPDENLQQYVNLVGRVIARQSSRPDVPYAFAVLDSPVPNAFAGPGGYIFITTGSLRHMSTEAELAGVLAHEIAHVTELHMIKTYRRSALLQGLSQAAAAADERAANYAAAVDEASDTLFNKGLDRNMEFEADMVGADLAALAGYDPAGLPIFLSKLASATNQRGGWYSTHPSLNDRIGRLNQQVQSLRAAGVVGTVQTERFQQNVTRVLGGQ
jgi:beta-barrel assembly-enhancing protease